VVRGKLIRAGTSLVPARQQSRSSVATGRTGSGTGTYRFRGHHIGIGQARKGTTGLLHYYNLLDTRTARPSRCNLSLTTTSSLGKSAVPPDGHSLASLPPIWTVSLDHRVDALLSISTSIRIPSTRFDTRPLFPLTRQHHPGVQRGHRPNLVSRPKHGEDHKHPGPNGQIGYPTPASMADLGSVLPRTRMVQFHMAGWKLKGASRRRDRDSDWTSVLASRDGGLTW
jgi:hypothetical protein